MITHEEFFGRAEHIALGVGATHSPHPGVARCWLYSPDAAGNDVVLPNPNSAYSNFKAGWPIFFLRNALGVGPSDTITIKKHDGTTLALLSTSTVSISLGLVGAAGALDWVVFGYYSKL